MQNVLIVVTIMISLEELRYLQTLGRKEIPDNQYLFNLACQRLGFPPRNQICVPYGQLTGITRYFKVVTESFPPNPMDIIPQTPKNSTVETVKQQQFKGCASKRPWVSHLVVQ
ncbi:MAG: hypothetical protein GY799_04665 [Desulfobulbaceae bacterium]|nr:hypothetical protein [Desulfobulbaceae bacterium]